MFYNRRWFFRGVKKIEDILFSLAVMIIFLPIVLVIMIISLIVQGWPIFYISKRVVGINDTIRIYKFRTMVKDAINPKYGLEEKYMKDGYLDVPVTADVYTPFGRFLEKTQLVEILQVFPALMGHMSFVGNRPLPPKNVEILKEKFPNKWQERFKSPAGITGITQIVGKFNLSSEQRLELESLYSQVFQEGNVLKADAYIFFSTIILLMIRDVTAYRSYESAKNILLTCLKR